MPNVKPDSNSDFSPFFDTSATVPEKILENTPEKPAEKTPKKPAEKNMFIKLVDALQKELQQNLHTTILDAISGTNELREYCIRFSWICKMDYALGVFKKIGLVALAKVEEEMKNRLIHKSALINSNDPKTYDTTEEFFLKMQTQMFLQNYVSILVQIIGYLLFRESSIAYPHNIEFNDAVSRLTDEKVAKILGMEGPFRSKKSIQILLGSVFLY